jgi:hypothetical protein
MVNVGNRESYRRDRVGEGEGQVPPTHKGEARIPSTVEGSRNTEVDTGVSKHRTSAYQQLNSTRERTCQKCH